MKIKHSDYPVKGTKSQLKLIEKRITFNEYDYKSYTRLISWHRTIGNKQNRRNGCFIFDEQRVVGYGKWSYRSRIRGGK